MKLAHAACAALSAALLVGVGCGAGDDLFSGGDALEGTGAGSSSSGPTSSSSSSSSSSESSSSSSVSSSSSTSAAGGASPTTTTTGGGGPGGSGTGGEPPGDFLDCGNTTCPLQQGSACCWDEHGQHGEPQAECVTGSFTEDDCLTAVEGDMFGFETRIECQVPDHCATGICCANRRQSQTVGSLYISVACSDECDIFEGGIQLCDNPGDTAGCPLLPTQNGGDVQSVCGQSQLLPTGYFVCGYP